MITQTFGLFNRDTFLIYRLGRSDSRLGAVDFTNISTMYRLPRPVTAPKILAGSLALGTLAALLLWQLGVRDALGPIGVPSFVAAGAAVGLVAGLAGAQAFLLWVDVALIAVYAAVAFTPIVSGPASRWVRRDVLPREPVAAVVVLSGDVLADSAINAGALERLLTGVELVKRGLAPRLVTTRVIKRYGGNAVNSDAAQLRLIRLAGLEGAWTILDSVGNTRDEAVRTAVRLLPTGARRIAVVTSPMHTRRACGTFEKVGFQVACVPAAEIEFVTANAASSTDRLAAARDYLYERLGMVKYRYKGWLPDGSR